MRAVTEVVRDGRRWLLAGVALLVLGGGVSWWAVARAGGTDDDSGGHGSAGTCAAEIVLAGRSYVGYGSPRRLPHPGPEVGRASVPACSDTNGQPAEPAGHVTAFELPGISRKTAVLADGGVWLRKDVTEPPARLRALYAPVRCTSTGRFTASGTLTGISTMPEGGDAHVRPPYTATMSVDDGPRSVLDGYRRVTVEVRVGSATKGGDDARLLRAALSGGTRVSATMRCDGTRFAAVSLRPAR